MKKRGERKRVAEAGRERRKEGPARCRKTARQIYFAGRTLRIVQYLREGSSIHPTIEREGKKESEVGKRGREKEKPGEERSIENMDVCRYVCMSQLHTMTVMMKKRAYRIPRYCGRV